MPLQNRVQPDGTILAHPARGTMMGNRGILHDVARRLGPTRWRHRAWVACVLSFKGRRRKLMAPGRYTELFFLDEAVALSAGHRPCAECRRADFGHFRALWTRAHGLPAPPRAPDMDAVLHAARAVPGGRHLRRHEAQPDDLPDGTIVHDGADCLLLVGSGALPVHPDGYGAPRPRPTGPVRLLTPPPTVAVLHAGYRPHLHPSAAK